MMKGRLRRGVAAADRNCAVDVIRLVPPLNANREPARDRCNVIVTGDKKERRSGKSKNLRDSLATMKRPGKTPGHCWNSTGDQGLSRARSRSGTGSSRTWS